MKEAREQELVMRWLSVADELTGRTRMEAVWIVVPVGAPVAAFSATHAA